MPTVKTSLPINPGKGLGFLVLGSSLYEVYRRLKTQRNLYPAIEISYSPEEPVRNPVVLGLPQNGLRLRFDGRDQRLCLIEILDFNKCPVTYQGAELVKPQIEASPPPAASFKSTTGPTFRQVYHKLFGPTHAGEYFAPSAGEAATLGTYILSYPGVAFSFRIPHSTWKPDGDFVALLSSSSAQAAHALALFAGGSWAEARHDLLARPLPPLRSLATGGRGRDSIPAELELIRIKGGGHVELVRRGAPTFAITLGETRAQDLVSQLGPPDAIHRKYDRKMSIHKNRTSSRSSHPPFALDSPGTFEGYSDTDRSSTHTEYSSPEDDGVPDGAIASSECFYNYFNHGLDIFISPHSGPSATTGPTERSMSGPSHAGKLVVTKLIIHGNIPGSYEFNKYKRSRWIIDSGIGTASGSEITSETGFQTASRSLEEAWQRAEIAEDDRRTLRIPMVLNRDWGDSPASSFDFAEMRGSADPDPEGNQQDPAVGTTQLYGFPRMLFEVLKNDTVSCLTLY